MVGVVRVVWATAAELQVREVSIDPHIGFCYNENVPHNKNASWCAEDRGVGQGALAALAVNIELSQSPPSAKASS
jgi:hypothetical protein